MRLGERLDVFYQLLDVCGASKQTSKTPISWTFLAIIPTVGAAICFSGTQNPWLSFAICLSATVYVIYLKKTSFQDALVFLKRFARIRTLQKRFFKRISGRKSLSHATTQVSREHGGFGMARILPKSLVGKRKVGTNVL